MSFNKYLETKNEINEAFLDSLKQGYSQNYQQAKQGAQQDYSKYADVAQKALEKAGNTAKIMSQKTGVPLPLATALIAAGITGGPTAIPFAALLYFVKQPLMKGANKAFDATWDTGAKAVGKLGQMMTPQPQPALQPEHLLKKGSFKLFIEADSWGDWAGEKIGKAAGTIAGNVAGYGNKIASALGNRAKEIGQWAKGNPKEVARMLFLVGAGAAIGAGVGKITHDIKDFVVQKIKDYGVPAEELNWLRQNVVLDRDVGESGKAHMSSSGHYTDPSHHGMKSAQDLERTSVGTNFSMEKAQGGKSAVNFIGTSSDSGGNHANFDAMVTNPTAGSSHSDIGDAYRSLAKQMHNMDSTGSMINHLKGVEMNPALALKRYGHDAAAEIKRRLASPDTYTKPAAIAGGIVGGTGNKRS